MKLTMLVSCTIYQTDSGIDVFINNLRSVLVIVLISLSSFSLFPGFQPSIVMKHVQRLVKFENR